MSDGCFTRGRRSTVSARAAAASGPVLRQHFIADVFIHRMAGDDPSHILAISPAIGEHEAQQRIGARVGQPLGNGALGRTILQPPEPVTRRLVPGGRKPLRPGHLPQLVERLHAFSDGPRRLHDDPCRRERGDELPLEVGRDRIAARLLVDVGREGEEGIIVLGLVGSVGNGGGGLAGSGAGGFVHGPRKDADSGRVGKRSLGGACASGSGAKPR